jgi:5-methylcytosine-specific restriction endonuclease McrA
MEQTLLLNATYEPLKIIGWQKAITLFYKGRVEILREHDREVRAVTFTFKLPSVVRLLKFVRLRKTAVVPFTRQNIYLRDDFTCQYCQEHFGQKPPGVYELTFDHVVPVTQGGTKGWENIVTACVRCNKRKGGRTPEEAGMTLTHKPTRPGSIPILRLKVGLRNAPQDWREFLYWNIELEGA